MQKFILPRISRRELPILVCSAVIGACVAGVYGIVHDQVTYTIAPEYYTRLKFDQFQWFDMGWNDRCFAACVGFLATWWLGLIFGWIIARRLVDDSSPQVICKKIALAFSIQLSVVFLAGFCGCVYGLWSGPDGDYSHWKPMLTSLGITAPWRFIIVAYIHNAGYLGGLLGLVITLFVVQPGTVGGGE